MQHLRSLECFVAVAKSKSIRAAAETVFLSSSALNRQILELEDELGVPLFERHARGIRLSAAGEAYLVYAKRALREAELVSSHIDALRGLRRGHIRLATVAAIADERFMAVVAQFQRTYPQVGFTHTLAGSHDVVTAVLETDADLGVVYNLPPHSDFHELAYKSYSMHAIVSSEHPLAGLDEVSLVTLQEYPIGLGDGSWGGRMLLDEYLHKTGMRLQPQFVSNSIEVLTKFVRATGGVCFQIRAGSTSERIDGNLVALPIKELQPLQRVMVLGSLKGRTLPPAAAMFSEALQRALFST